jgi:dTDP-glucose 4,6-dehydratase
MEGKPLPLYGNGKNVRDWLHVMDHCEALWLILTQGKAGEVYNIGADNERNNIEIAKRILARFKSSGSKIAFVADRPGHDLRYAIDGSKMRREFGWKPKHSFISGFDQTIDWYIKNLQWIERVKKRTGAFNSHIR